MAKAAAGKPEPELIPAGQNTGSAQSTFGNIVDAISQIQQFAVMERSGQEIPEDFLTLRGALNFFHIGFGNGLIEGIIFALLTALILPISSDEKLMTAVSEYFPLAGSRLFLWALNCAPIIIAVAICSFLSRYRIGMITKKAVDSLLMGRCFCLLIKGILLFVLLITLNKHLTDESARRFSLVFSLRNADMAESVFRVINSTMPHIVMTAYQTLAIFFTAMIIPFCSIWLVSFYRKSQERRAEIFWSE
ncbi:Uncharacterized protein dnl_62820 [Desulfonema limicola]|uniref:Uncharacterized protein n=1 Tax=Desulfonema limicola TaxID=45656 RepID=A0A975GJQ9_9BACT|nr:hypothetical protein [Desulfonema limicola]QTA83861.1 Uncharacterized protein dnl_62820 [Desulfonema limicola]